MQNAQVQLSSVSDVLIAHTAHILVSIIVKEVYVINVYRILNAQAVRH